MAIWKVLCVVLGVLLGGGQLSSAADAKPCDRSSCRLPNCRCTGTDIPGSIPRDQTPQIIMITFDDAVSVLLHDQFYKTLLSDFKNPNGCPIGMTFFASHEYCDYALVNEMWRKGHEIASHSISHKADIDYWKKGNEKLWTDELVGMRQILENFAKIPRDDVKGVRVPFLQPGGNKQFKVMRDNGFLWDCSLPTRTQVKPGIWPYSLNYRSTQQCQIGPCPTESFPGFWVVPMLDLIDQNENPCAMLDTCIADYQNETFSLLWNNFLRSYDGNRAPFGLFVHAAWFLNNPVHWKGYLQFLHEVQKKNGVYFVTVSQALEWTRKPVPLSDIKSYKGWKTQCNERTNDCTSIGNGRTCRLMKQEEWGPSERYMRICDDMDCPDVYPWVGNPDGTEE